MSLKVCIYPRARPESISEFTGVGRVVYALARYLKHFDIEVVDRPEKADVLAPHMQLFDMPIGFDAQPTVLHSHGLYWTADEGLYSNYARKANESIAASTRRADHITVPATWVAEYLKRDCRIVPTVIGHGIDLDKWQHARNEGYIFYGKNREADVCTSKWAYEFAKRGEFVISTFMPYGAPRLDEKKFQVMGALPAPIMKDRLEHAEVYLATTKETFGITTLEAMASYVPVLGFNWGGTKDIVRHKVDGYLAHPYDMNDLIAGLEFIREHRQELAHNARKRAEEFSWQNVIGRYAELYHALYRGEIRKETGVTVVVTNYNYQQYVGEAVDSVLGQTYPVDEIIVVDDGSTDDSRNYLEVKYLNEPRVKLLFQKNQGVAAARNNGVRVGTQPFVVCLDADDKLDPAYVETCRNKMLLDRALGITYTGLVFFNDITAPDKSKSQLTPFDFNLQLKGGIPPATCIPCAAMFRREMWERAGGYKQRYAPAEDTEFWIRGLMTGFTCEVASKEGLFFYRGHQGSASRTLRYGRIDDDKPYVVDKHYPFAAPSPQAPPVHSYSEPAITIVLEVQGGQEYNVPNAIDSVLGQTIREWRLQLLARNVDTGLLNELLKPYPFVVWEESTEIGTHFFIRLPADNYLRADAIERFALAMSQKKMLTAGEMYRFPERIDMRQCCGGNGDSILEAKRMLGMLPRETVPVVTANGLVRMMFIGERKGPVGYTFPGSRDTYFGANNDANRFILAKPEHVQWLSSTGVFQVFQEERPVERKSVAADYQIDVGKMPFGNGELEAQSGDVVAEQVAVQEPAASDSAGTDEVAIDTMGTRVKRKRGRPRRTQQAQK